MKKPLIIKILNLISCFLCNHKKTYINKKGWIVCWRCQAVVGKKVVIFMNKKAYLLTKKILKSKRSK